MRTIKRRPYDGDVISPEDTRKATDSLAHGLTGLGEHNFKSSTMRSQVTMSNMAAGVAYRVAHAYRGSDTIVQTCLSGNPESALGALVFKETDTWKTVWETSWKSTEIVDYHAMANVQTGHSVNTGGNLPTTNSPDDIDSGFLHLDGTSLQLAWILDGDMPAEHVRGSLDTGSSGINMERGFGGQYNAQDVSAVFMSVPPGSHTLRLVVLRTTPVTGANIPNLKAYVPMFEALVWGIHR